MVATLTGVVLTLAVGLAAGAPAEAATAPHGTKAAKPKLIPRDATKTRKRPPVPVQDKDSVLVVGGPSGFFAVGGGCTAPARQSAGWWYRRCGWDWQTSFSFGGNVLLEYQHQYYSNGRWVPYLSTWCQPLGSCIYGTPNDVHTVYDFFYQ
jgi:hypothetical protein